MTKKTLIAITAVVLVLFCTVGATLAWLVATSGPVKNTFTYGDINITLAETTGTEYKMIPGGTISKDPEVTVKANSEACYLFVKIEESTNFDAFMTYAIATGWIQLQNDSTAENVPGVYYREVSANTADQSFYVLKDNKVSVKNTVTKDNFKDLTTTEGDSTATNYPTLTFTAYAVQKEGFATAYTAWQKASK